MYGHMHVYVYTYFDIYVDVFMYISISTSRVRHSQQCRCWCFRQLCRCIYLHIYRLVHIYVYVHIHIYVCVYIYFFIYTLTWTRRVRLSARYFSFCFKYFFLCVCWAAPLHHGVPWHHLRVGCCVTVYSMFSRAHLLVSWLSKFFFSGSPCAPWCPCAFCTSGLLLSRCTSCQRESSTPRLASSCIVVCNIYIRQISNVSNTATVCGNI